jgi:hypothetical protein
VVALSGVAGVALDGGLCGGAADARRLVGGVSHAWCGQFGQDRVEGRAGLGSEIAADRADAVEVLFADGQAAAGGPVVVAEVAVGVQTVGQRVGQLGQLVGAVFTGEPGQLGFGFGAGLDVDEVGQSMDEPADHRDVAGAEVAVALRLGGGGQRRRQRLTVQRPAPAEVGGFVHTPGGFGPADPQPVRQRGGQLAAQLGGIGLLGELVDQRMLDRRQHAAYLFAVLQHAQPLRGGQHVERQVHRAFHASLERVEHLDDLLTATRTHVRIITTGSDNSGLRN